MTKTKASVLNTSAESVQPQDLHRRKWPKLRFWPNYVLGLFGCTLVVKLFNQKSQVFSQTYIIPTLMTVYVP